MLQERRHSIIVFAMSYLDFLGKVDCVFTETSRPFKYFVKGSSKKMVLGELILRFIVFVWTPHSAEQL